MCRMNDHMLDYTHGNYSCMENHVWDKTNIECFLRLSCIGFAESKSSEWV